MPGSGQPPPGSTVLAGYMTISNPGQAAITLSSVSSPDFRAVEVHRTVVEDSVARMLPVGQLEISAGSQVVLEPGSFHLMLFDPARALTAGDTVTLLLHTNHGVCVTAQAPVVRAAGDTHKNLYH